MHQPFPASEVHCRRRQRRGRFGVSALTGLAVSIASCSYYTSANERSDDAGATDASSPVTDSASGASSGTSASSSASSGSSGVASSSSSASSASSSSSTGGPPLGTFEQAVLDGLNAARTAAQPTPDPPLPVLYWDHEAAASCAAYTETCSQDAGPNGMVTGSGSAPMTASRIVGFFTASKNDYEHAINRCNGDVTMCEFYKMVLQRSVVKVGCSVQTCASEDTWACRFTQVGDTSLAPY